MVSKVIIFLKCLILLCNLSLIMCQNSIINNKYTHTSLDFSDIKNNPSCKSAKEILNKFQKVDTNINTESNKVLKNKIDYKLTDTCSSYCFTQTQTCTTPYSTYTVELAYLCVPSTMMCTTTAQCAQFGPNYMCENDYLLQLTEGTGVSCPVNEGWCLDATTMYPACITCSSCGPQPPGPPPVTINGNFIADQQLVNLLPNQWTIEVQNVFIDTILYVLRDLYFVNIPTITINFPIVTSSSSNRKTLQSVLDVNYAFNFDAESDEIDEQYNDIKSLLITSVNDNNFDLYLHQIAADQSVASLDSVTCNSINVSPLTVSGAPSSNPATVTSSSSIGIIIGVIVAIIIFLASYVFYYNYTLNLKKKEEISKAIKDYAIENPINVTNTNTESIVYGQQNSTTSQMIQPQNINKV